jgi:hypothetical protein
MVLEEVWMGEQIHGTMACQIVKFNVEGVMANHGKPV